MSVKKNRITLRKILSKGWSTKERTDCRLFVGYQLTMLEASAA
jgi:hypothetical protein